MTSIIKAVHQVMTKVGYAQKKKTNQHHGYKYVGEADLLEVIRPAMVEAGLVLLPRVTSVSGPDANGVTNVTISYTLAHTSGEMMPDAVIMSGQGGDFSKSVGRAGDKGVYKALTGANKYALFKLFQIETGDDPEGSTSPSEFPDPKVPARTQPSGPIKTSPKILARPDPADGHEYDDEEDDR